MTAAALAAGTCNAPSRTTATLSSHCKAHPSKYRAPACHHLHRCWCYQPWLLVAVAVVAATRHSPLPCLVQRGPRMPPPWTAVPQWCVPAGRAGAERGPSLHPSQGPAATGMGGYRVWGTGRARKGQGKGKEGAAGPIEGSGIRECEHCSRRCCSVGRQVSRLSRAEQVLGHEYTQACMLGSQVSHSARQSSDPSCITAQCGAGAAVTESSTFVG